MGVADDFRDAAEQVGDLRDALADQTDDAVRDKGGRTVGFIQHQRDLLSVLSVHLGGAIRRVSVRWWRYRDGDSLFTHQLP